MAAVYDPYRSRTGKLTNYITQRSKAASSRVGNQTVAGARVASYLLITPNQALRLSMEFFETQRSGATIRPLSPSTARLNWRHSSALLDGVGLGID